MVDHAVGECGSIDGVFSMALRSDEGIKHGNGAGLPISPLYTIYKLSSSPLHSLKPACNYFCYRVPCCWGVTETPTHVLLPNHYNTHQGKGFQNLG